MKLVRAAPLHVAQDGLFAYANLTGAVTSSSVGIGGGLAADAVLHARATVVNDGDAAAGFCASFALADATGAVVQTATAYSGAGAAPPRGGSAEVRASLSVGNAQLWSTPRPYLYNLTVQITPGTCEGVSDTTAVDGLWTTTGFRSLRYDANHGFFLNDEHYKVRGFCDHNNLGGVGMAVPDRFNLFRAQASRSVGGNGRRTSHNPPNPETLDIYDRLGIVVMDENRLFANDTAFVNNMGDLVRRDRNHPSVVIWSFCNEAGCEGGQETGGPRFKAVTYAEDGSRPVLANMFTFNDLLSRTIDVQGFSHQSREKLDNCHAQMPDKPIFMSECCSCNTMRDEDVGHESSDGRSKLIQKSFNADCVQSQTNASNGADYAVGTMVWTLFDYFGEPSGGWPHVSSTFGQFDLGGFAKAAAYWYRAHWLHRIPDSSPDKTYATGENHLVHIVESWESPDTFPTTKGNKTRDITAYADVGSIELFVNGASQGVRTPADPDHSSGNSWGEWKAVPWAPGNLTAVARDATGAVVATDTRLTCGKAVALRLTLDCPSAATGTGTSLVLDGQDAALLRAAVVDANGEVVHMAANNITFNVVSGPGRVVGTTNGDPGCHEPNHAPWHSAYHGLVRGVVMVTQDRASSYHARARMLEVDGATAGGGHHPVVVAPDDASPAATEIVVEISTPGLPPARVAIPLSSDASADGYLAAAAAAAGKPVTGFD